MTSLDSVAGRLVFGSGDRFRGGLFVGFRQLLRTELEVQLVDCPGETEREFISEFIYRGPRINSYVEGLVDGHEQWNRVWDRFPRYFLAVNREHAGATLAGARSIVLEVKD